MALALRDIDRYTVLPNGCWQWNGAPTPHGYGQAERDGRNQRAHRYVYERLVGPIPAGHDLDHLCHNEDVTCAGGFACLHRRCVNPSHLEPITNAENQARAARRATHCPNGHEWNDANTFTRANRNSWRECRTCMNARSRAYRKAQRGDQTR